MKIPFRSAPAHSSRKVTRWIASLALLSLAAACAPEAVDDTDPIFAYPLDDLLRMNHIQMVGTHNSYHIAPDLPPEQRLPELDYTHAPLAEQLGEQGVRQFELDIFYDRIEERFAVYHIPLVDEGTTCPWLTECLQQMLDWSDANRGHHPLFIFIEPKNMDVRRGQEVSRYDTLDAEIRSIWPRERMFTPDDLQGDFSSLRESVLTEGWPTLGQGRGMAVFVMLDTDREVGGYHYDYTNGLESLEGRVLFITAEADDPYAAFMKMDGPIHQFAEIQQAVRDGFMIRTRSDSPPFDYETDYPRSVSAVASSAHMISTDYPVEGMMDGYFLDIPGGTPSRCNPLVAPPECTSEAIESEQWLQPIGFR